MTMILSLIIAVFAAPAVLAQCSTGYYYDGSACYYPPNCPYLTSWHNSVTMTCVNQCPSGTYFAQGTLYNFATATTTFYQECQICSSSCATCSTTNGVPHCTSCPIGKFFDGSGCYDTCPSGYGRTSDMTCQPCSSLCGVCLGPTDSDCTVYCPFGWQNAWLVPCVSCDSSCRTCIGGSNNQCLSCPSGKYLSSNTCLPNRRNLLRDPNSP